MRTGSHAPLTLYAVGAMPPLCDAAGEPYQALPCMADPPSWDYDAPPYVRRRSAALCAPCPAWSACTTRRTLLGLRASGVWAGVEYDCVTRIMPTDDEATLTRAAAAGVTITPLTSHQENV